jgi:hypothetical protein
MNTVVVQRCELELRFAKDDDGDFLDILDSNRVSVDLGTVIGTGGDDSDREKKGNVTLAV